MQASETIDVPRLPKQLDRRDQRHVEPARGERIGQPAGQVVKQPYRRSRRFESVHERLAVQIVDGTDAHGGLTS